MHECELAVGALDETTLGLLNTVYAGDFEEFGYPMGVNRLPRGWRLKSAPGSSPNMTDALSTHEDDIVCAQLSLIRERDVTATRIYC